MGKLISSTVGWAFAFGPSLLKLFRISAEVVGWAGLGESLNIWRKALTGMELDLSSAISVLGVSILLFVYRHDINRWLYTRFPGFKAEISKVAEEIPAPMVESNDDEMIPLSEGARIAFEAVDGSEFAKTARNEFHAPHGALCYVATKLFYCQLPIYGKHLPSSNLALVDNWLLFGADFAEDVALVKKTESGVVTHIDLQVKRSDLNVAIEKLKNSVGARLREKLQNSL